MKVSSEELSIRLPLALTIAGSDPSGGAGLQADLKTFHQAGVYGMSAVTLITVENTVGVRAVHVLDGDLVGSQIDAVVEGLEPAAARTGALGSADVIEAVADRAVRFSFPLIVDPVMVSKHGDPLIDEGARSARRTVTVMSALSSRSRSAGRSPSPCPTRPPGRGRARPGNGDASSPPEGTPARAPGLLPPGGRLREVPPRRRAGRLRRPRPLGPRPLVHARRPHRRASPARSRATTSSRPCWPSARVAPEFQAYDVVMKDGRVLSGLQFYYRGTRHATLLLADGREVRFPLGRVLAHAASPMSQIPDGLEEEMTAGDFRDPLAFLLRER